LTSINLPESVTSIGTEAFSNCKSLISITIPSNVAIIDALSFDSCDSLQSITFSGDVSSIGAFAFDRCSHLKFINLPGSVSSIGISAFTRCTNLESVSYLGDADPYKSGASAFDGCNKLKTICVSESYSSTTFCGRNISCKSSQCIVNHCYETIGAEDLKCIVRKKPDVMKWENETNECVVYRCDNESGMSVEEIKCKNGDNITICKDGKCVEEDKRWAVVVVIKSSETVSAHEIVKELSNMTGIDENEMTIGIEYDENGNMNRIIVYVKDEKQAKIMSEAVEKYCKSAPYERSCGAPIVREITSTLSLSCGHNHHIPVVMVLLTTLISLIFSLRFL